jgi:hypothetical protein
VIERKLVARLEMEVQSQALEVGRRRLLEQLAPLDPHRSHH